ncbi:MAG: hypothetical protein AAFV45_01400 [Pseudomonadota bacterium]
MPAAAALYLNDTDIDFSLHFKDLKEEGLCCGHPEVLRAQLGDERVRFDVLHGKAMADHVAGFAKYIETLDEDAGRKTAAIALLDDVAIVLRLVTDAEWSEEMWQATGMAADTLDGLLFAFDSIIMPSGVVLAGPLRKQHESIRDVADDDILED